MLLCGLWYCCKYTCVAMLSRNILYCYLDYAFDIEVTDYMCVLNLLFNQQINFSILYKIHFINKMSSILYKFYSLIFI